MRRLAVLVLFACAAIVAGVAGLACGNGIEGGEEAELTVVTPEIEVTHMEPGTRSRSLEALTLRNDGDGDLQIHSIEWVDEPTRVSAYHDGQFADDETTCSTNADCGGEICLTQSEQCRERGFRDTSEPVGANVSFEQPLVVEADPNEQPVQCPEPGDDVPEEYADDYCGAIDVETNAVTGDEHVDQDGSTRIYLTTGGASGDFHLPETVLQFTFATWGTTQTEEFVIENQADGDLEINEMTFSTNPGWFEATPARPDVDRVDQLVVEGQDSETITLEMEPPARDDLTEEEREEEEIDFQTDVNFETSSPGLEDSMIVQVTSGPGDVPLAEVEPLQLSFEDGEPKTLEVQNFGTVPLTVNGMSISPHEVEDHYSITHEGDEMLGTDHTVTISSAENDPDAEDDDAVIPGVEEFEVELTDPDGETIVGELEVRHTDSLSDNVSVVTLLGDASEVAVGQIQPRQVRFRANAGGETEERYLVLSNEGNTDLIVDGVDLDGDGTTDPADYTVEATGGQDLEDLEVAPGELRELKVSYDGDTESPQNLTVDVESNHAGQQDLMRFTVSGQELASTNMDISIAPGFPDVAQVDQQTTFAVSDEAGQARLDQATWLLHDRPAGSEAVVDGVGEETSMIPDAAGDYRISVIVDDGDQFEIQEVFEFEAAD